MILSEVQNLLARKNRNYGNSALTPPELADVSVETALLVRLSDKIKRLKTLYSGEPDRVGESIDDTIKDTIGYLALLLLARNQSGTQQ